ncbi:MAG: hypothetical protein ACE5KA_07535 [Nitrososphaerales archaeon]
MKYFTNRVILFAMLDDPKLFLVEDHLQMPRSMVNKSDIQVCSACGCVYNRKAMRNPYRCPVCNGALFEEIEDF